MIDVVALRGPVVVRGRAAAGGRAAAALRAGAAVVRRRSPPAWALLAGLLAYQALVSPLLFGLTGGGRCRFEPSCSAYAAGAVRGHGAVRGALLAVRRLGRCHPWGGSGEDPVPPRSTARRPTPSACSAPPRGGSTRVDHR